MGISPHVARLRSLVGTELLQLPSVAVLPRDDEGRVLLVRQADTGVWGVLGGAIELDEDPENAARREVREEVGLVVELGDLIGVFSGPEYRVRYANGDEASYVVATWSAVVTGGELMPDGVEILEADWIEVDRIMDLVLNPLARALIDSCQLSEWPGPPQP